MAKYTGAFPTKTIKKGSKGTNVTRWQKYLKWMGYSLKADSVFGSVTKEKTKACQKKLGFTGKAVDGIVGPKTIEKAKAYSKADPVQTKTCIDVSYWQGKISQANWEKVRKTCEYAICRASYTSQSKFSLNRDSTFSTNFVNAKAAGLKVGAYHYSQAITVAEAKAEAEYLCNILKDFTPTFYVVCDFEYGKRLNSKIGKKASDIANAFCDVVKAHGYNPCIYANTSTLNTNLTNPKYPVWVAQYASSCTYNGAKVMWQYTSSGKVSGINGKVDISYVYQDCPQDAIIRIPTPVSNPGKYTGELPDLVVHSGQIIAYTARDLAYAKGTAKSKYTYPKGSPKQAFKTAINKVYPKRSSWSKQCQAGASCDVGAGTIIRYSGIDTKVPRGLEEQIQHFKKSSLWKKTGETKCKKAGDVALHSGTGSHIWIGLGDGNLAEANHTWKFFEHITKDERTVAGKQNGAVYRASKASPIRKGHRGTEVAKWQAFLNWAGFNCGKADGIFGDNTLSATKAFQKKHSITDDGIVGSNTLAKAGTYI